MGSKTYLNTKSQVREMLVLESTINILSRPYEEPSQIKSYITLYHFTKHLYGTATFSYIYIVEQTTDTVGMASGL